MGLGSRVAYPFKKNGSEKVKTVLGANNKIDPHKAVEVNTDNFYGRVFHDDEGLAGQEHATNALTRIAKRKAEKEALAEKIKGHRENIKGNRDMLNDASLDDTSKKDINDMIKKEEDKIKSAAGNVQHGMWGTYGGVAKDTFHAMNSGDFGQVATKWGAVVAGGAILNGTGRALTGGGVTYNATGERDIMGIPLV